MPVVTAYQRPMFSLLGLVEAQAEEGETNRIHTAIRLLVNETLAIHAGVQKDAAKRLGVTARKLNHYLEGQGQRPIDHRRRDHGQL